MTAPLLVATTNPGKRTEFMRILQAAGLSRTLLLPGDLTKLGAAPTVREDAATFAGNAVLKAEQWAQWSGLPVVADDSGLCVDALHGMPGVLSARWSGRFGVAHPGGVDVANVALLLDQLRDVPETRRTAQFVCAAAYCDPGSGEVFVCEGQLAGRIVHTPAGTGGFGYDPIFAPAGHAVTTAELTPEQKDGLSHRGQALRSLASVLAQSRGPDTPAPDARDTHPAAGG